MSETDNKIVCPHCGSHNCFVEEINGVKSYLCMECGYSTNGYFKEGSESLIANEMSLPELFKELRWVDPQTNLVWFPTVLNFPTIGIVFPDGTNKDDWKWRAAPAVDVPQEEQMNYPIPGQPGQFYTKKVSMEASRLFLSDQFYQACKYVGFIRE